MAWKPRSHGSLKITYTEADLMGALGCMCVRGEHTECQAYGCACKCHEVPITKDEKEDQHGK